MKRCHQCRKDKPLEAFYQDGRGRRFSPCRECRIEKKRKERAKNPDAFRAKDREWYAANIEKYRATKRAYARTPKRKKQQKAWREKNPNFSAEWQRQDRVKWKFLAMEKLGGKKCSFLGCKIEDPDMLEIDHVNNDGKSERAEVAGITILRRIALEKNNGRYQVLCANHHRKKHLTELRERRNVKV